MDPASILVPHTHAAHGSTKHLNLQASNPVRKTLSICPIYTFHVRYPMQPLCVLQPLNCVSHENRRARHAIKWGRRLFSCLAHMQRMEPSCTNKFPVLKPCQKNFVCRSLTPLLFCMLTPLLSSTDFIFI